MKTGPQNPENVLTSAENFCELKPGLLSPMKLPSEEECFKCSLLCEIKFKYPKTTNWQINATTVMYKEAANESKVSEVNKLSQERLLRWYVTHTDGLVREDIEYNGRVYQLEFIEFFAPALHSLPKVATSENSPAKREKYDVEMVMVHRSLDSKGATDKTTGETNWLNVSVPIHSMYTYSLSQDFFAQMIQPVCQNTYTYVEPDEGFPVGTIVVVEGKGNTPSTIGIIKNVKMLFDSSSQQINGYDGTTITKFYEPSKVQVKEQSSSSTTNDLKRYISELDETKNTKFFNAYKKLYAGDSNDYKKYISNLQKELMTIETEQKTENTEIYTFRKFIYNRKTDSANTAYYLVQIENEATPRFVPAYQVKKKIYENQCPWTSIESNDYTSMGSSISALKPVNTAGTNQTCQVHTGTTNITNSCQPITVNTNWNPYQGLPYQKALYIYGGMFPYAPCLYDETDTVTWVVMKHPVPMHTAEYERLLALIKPDSVKDGSNLSLQIEGSKFLMNDGDAYTLADPAGRNVYYNDGGMIQNDADQEKFYIKCAKAHDSDEKEAVAAYIASGATDSEKDEDLAAIGIQYTPLEYQASLLSFYKPPTNPISTIMICFVLSILLFSLFAVFYYNRATNAEGDTSSTKWYSNMLFAFVAICVFIMYGMSFLSVSVVGLGTLVAGVIFSAILYVLNFFGKQMIKSEKRAMKYSYYVLFGVVSFLLLAMVMTPTFYYTPFVTYDRSFFYINGDINDEDNDIQIFIGTRPALAIEFAGYTLHYRNEYTVSQQYAGSTKVGKVNAPVNVKSLNIVNPPSETISSSGSALKDPNMMFLSISNSFWNPNTTKLLIPTPTHFASDSSPVSAGDENETEDNIERNNLLQQRLKQDNLLLTEKILLAYDAHMKTDNTLPFVAFVQAASSVLQGTESAQAQTSDQVRTAIADNYPQLYAYLNRKRIDMSLSEEDVIRMADASSQSLD